MPISRRRALAGSAALTLALPLAARAQPAAAEWPQRSVQMLIPYPPGGSADLVARPLSIALQPRLGQPVVLDYKPGAGGTLASGLLARARPDGYTLIMVLAAHAINQSLYPRLPYDTRKDFAPVSWVANLPFVLVVGPTMKVRSVQELIAEARAQPGKLTFASAGIGNTGHLAGEMFASSLGIKMTHVPYKGSAAVVNALMAGEVDLAFDTVSTAMPQVASGRLRGLATTGAQRSSLAPDLPTMREAGVPDFVVDGWYAVMAPAGTPPAIRERLQREIVAALAQPELKKQLAASGYQTVGSTPAELDQHIQREIDRWAQVVKSSGAQAE
ncbi:tripartite tricarboxylate transporter substrate binding protein [Xylophilus sp. Kf1]|nr:tripartite tricarboxylate transporter substrate binding protein [Xylophilus sp. Kf1]